MKAVKPPWQPPVEIRASRACVPRHRADSRSLVLATVSPMPVLAVLLAGERWIETGYVFTDVRGHPVNPDHVGHIFQQLVRAHDLPPIRLHDLRHVAATLAPNPASPSKSSSTRSDTAASPPPPTSTQPSSPRPPTRQLRPPLASSPAPPANTTAPPTTGPGSASGCCESAPPTTDAQEHPHSRSTRHRTGSPRRRFTEPDLTRTVNRAGPLPGRDGPRALPQCRAVNGFPLVARGFRYQQPQLAEAFANTRYWQPRWATRTDPGVSDHGLHRFHAVEPVLLKTYGLTCTSLRRITSSSRRIAFGPVRPGRSSMVIRSFSRLTCRCITSSPTIR